MKLTIFDGAKTIGGNKIYVEENDRGVFLDSRMNFAKRAEYFEEFLRERSSGGVYDPLYLGLIPRLNIYRSDLIPQMSIFHLVQSQTLKLCFLAMHIWIAAAVLDF